jgi:hypothetical protein
MAPLARRSAQAHDVPNHFVVDGSSFVTEADVRSRRSALSRCGLQMESGADAASGIDI